MLCDQHPFVCVEADDDSSKAMDDLYSTVSKCELLRKRLPLAETLSAGRIIFPQSELSPSFS